MKCSLCQSKSHTLLTTINQKNNQIIYLCNKCLIYSSTENLLNIEELDNLIQEVNILLSKCEALNYEGREEKLEDAPEEIRPFLFNPSKIHNLAKEYKSTYIKQKQIIFDSFSEKEKLTYQLKKAIENENYEKASFYKSKLDEIN